MKRTLSNKFKITTLLLACIIAAAIYIAKVGLGVTYALFSDKDAGKSAVTNMATVDIELEQQFDESIGYGVASITNNSNIDIYLRVGFIFELLTESGEPVIADANGMKVTAGGLDLWQLHKKELVDGNNTYTKWFAEYASSEGAYRKLKTYENIYLEFLVKNIPEGCKVVVNAVPEAVQADEGDNALKYFKNLNYLAW